MTATELIALKQYMRIDGNIDDELVTALDGAAEKYLANAGIIPCTDPLYMLCRHALTLHYYDRREAVGNANEAEIPLGLRQIINQLKADGLGAK